MKIASRKDILEYIRAYDKDYRVEDNVVYARKAFLVNTVIQWCLYQVNTKRMNPGEMNFYLQAISSFMEGETNIYWDAESNLVIS
tara:strand:- start:1169 stop:1423 length:255 start_codon:yes stop_codon:yes gene_type:complete